MSKWIITPDKFLSEEEVKRLRKACEESSIIARSKGNQIAVRDSETTKIYTHPNFELARDFINKIPSKNIK